jgi:RNA polymerase sigma-70 factor, ECF subfamily
VDYSKLSPSELLLSCLRTGGEPAWVEFVRRFQPLIASVVLRTARQWGDTSPEIVDDLIQETFLKICTDREDLAAKFQPEHPDAIFGYIKVLTGNLVHDYFRASHSLKRGKTITSSLHLEAEPQDNLGPSRSGTPPVEQAILISQIDASLRSIEVSPHAERDRHIFWLYYRVGMSASAIAALPKFQLSTKGVESTLFRLTRHVKAKLCSHPEPTRPDLVSGEGIRPPEPFSKE